MDATPQDKHQVRRVGRPRKAHPAQDLVNRIWKGQSVSLLRKERIELLKNGLAQHGITLDQIEIPHA